MDSSVDIDISGPKSHVKYKKCSTPYTGDLFFAVKLGVEQAIRKIEESAIVSPEQTCRILNSDQSFFQSYKAQSI